MSSLLIREANREDLPAVAQLWEQLDTYHRQVGLAFPKIDGAKQAWLASFERTLGRFSFLWVAEDKGELVAFLLARLKRTPAYLGGVIVGEISDMFISQSLRGQNIAALLVELALNQFRAIGVHSVEVQVMEQNDLGKKFWSGQGFQTELVQVRRFLKTEQKLHD